MLPLNPPAAPAPPPELHPPPPPPPLPTPPPLPPCLRFARAVFRMAAADGMMDDAWLYDDVGLSGGAVAVSIVMTIAFLADADDVVLSPAIVDVADALVVGPQRLAPEEATKRSTSYSRGVGRTIRTLFSTATGRSSTVSVACVRGWWALHFHTPSTLNLYS